MKEKQVLWLVVGFLAALVAMTAMGHEPENAAEWPRYEVQDFASGTSTYTIKLDRATGQTWVFSSSRFGWVEVEDGLPLAQSAIEKRRKVIEDLKD